MSALPAALEQPAAPMVSASPVLIINPRSFLASRGSLLARVTALAARYGAQVIQASAPAQLNGELDRLRAQGEQRIFVLSGDGTVQGIVQYLAQLPPGAWLPQLLLLGGGRSNLIVRDFGGRGAVKTLAAALRRCREGGQFAVHERQLLRIEQEGTPPQHGFFVAGSMIDCGIRLCHEHRLAGRSWLHQGPLSSPYCLIKLAVKVAFGRSPLPPYPQLRIDTGTADAMRGPCRVLIATTLLHEDSLYDPYAARGEGPIRVTAVAADVPRFWRRLPRLLTGRFSADMNPQEGYFSGRYERVQITGLSSYSLDGEMFDTDPTRPVVIRGGLLVRLLQP